LRKVLMGPVVCQLEDDRVEGAINLRSLISGAKGLPQGWRPYREPSNLGRSVFEAATVSVR
jgi:hypothetical protein